MGRKKGRRTPPRTVPENPMPREKSTADINREIAEDPMEARWLNAGDRMGNRREGDRE